VLIVLLIKASRKCKTQATDAP